MNAQRQKVSPNVSLLTVYFLCDFFGNVFRKLRLQGLPVRHQNGKICRTAGARPRLIFDPAEALQKRHAIFIRIFIGDAL
ncbi:hypothetical protein [Paraburkholderia oxyphila]|uniref:hypothetical protein n=1 Tax=Paraburkholderia oxyphila TaxID=614212 RepID=UPI0012EEB3EE|nr:hypothetical protein [Paraburkholderia oxyphila]